VESQLNPSQHAYRKNHSCHSALNIFSQSIYDALDKPKNKVVAIFFDLRAAFDSVNHDILIRKLMEKFAIEPRYINVLHEVLSDRTFKITGSD